MSPDEYRRYLDTEKLAAKAQREEEATRAEARQQAEAADAQWAAQTAELRKKAFKDDESMTRYYKMMLGRPWTYTHSHGVVTVTGAVRLGDVRAGSTHARVDFTLFILAGAHKTAQAAKLTFTRDLDVWELDAAEFESSIQDEWVSLAENYEWGKQYVNYLLYGR